MLGLLLVVALTGAACGGGGDEGGTTGGTGGSPSALSLPDLTGQKISVVAVWTGAEQENFEKVLAAFDEATGAETTFQSAGSADLSTFLGGKIEGKNPPDVAMLPNPGLMTQFADQGALQPIDDVAGDLVDANFAPIWRELGTVDGQLYGVYFKAANKSTFWYNKNVFSQAGVQPPATWDELATTSQTVSDFGVTPFGIDGGSGWPLTDWFENVYIRTAGPEMYDKLAKHEIPWTDPSVKTALETLAQVWKGEWIAGGTSGALNAQFPDTIPRVFSEPPEAAMYYEGDFVAGVIGSETNATLGTDADFFDFPSISNTSPAVVGGADVAVLLKDSPGGKALMQYLASPEAAEVWVKLGGFISPNKNVSLEVYPDDIIRRAAQALIAAQDSFRFDMSDLQPAEFGGTTGQGMFKAFQDFLRDPTDTDGVMQYLESSAADAYKGG